MIHNKGFSCHFVDSEIEQAIAFILIKRYLKASHAIQTARSTISTTSGAKLLSWAFDVKNSQSQAAWITVRFVSPFCVFLLKLLLGGNFFGQFIFHHTNGIIFLESILNFVTQSAALL